MSEAAAVFDSSALLAILFGEPAGDAVDLLASAAMSALNLSETLAKLRERGIEADQAVREIDSLDLRIHDFDVAQARAAAWLRPLTKSLGLSLGDRACLALGAHLQAPIVTADRAWLSLQDTLDTRIICVR